MEICEFVSFTIAKKLKEKGYTLDTAHHYDDNGGIVVSLVEFDERCVYPCPEIHQALRWLREEKKLHIGISPQWQYTVYDMRCSPWIGRSDMQNYDDYTKAVIAGIEYCLDNLI